MIHLLLKKIYTPSPFRTRDCQMSLGKVKTQRRSSGCYGITLGDWGPGHSTLELKKMLVTPSLLVNENNVSALGTTAERYQPWVLRSDQGLLLKCHLLVTDSSPLEQSGAQQSSLLCSETSPGWAWFWRHSSPLAVPQRALSWSRGQACHLPRWPFGNCLLGCILVTKAQDG